VNIVITNQWKRFFYRIALPALVVVVVVVVVKEGCLVTN
jgi:hypothetical protein